MKNSSMTTLNSVNVALGDGNIVGYTQTPFESILYTHDNSANANYLAELRILSKSYGCKLRQIPDPERDYREGWDVSWSHVVLGKCQVLKVNSELLKELREETKVVSKLLGLPASPSIRNPGRGLRGGKPP